MASRHDEFMKAQPYLPFNMGGRLTEAMIAKAKAELGETEEVKAKTIPELRRLVQAEPDLVCPTNDAYLLQYLRTRKFNVKKAFTVLKNYYLVKKTNKDLYGSFDEKAIRRALGLRAGHPLFYRDEEGCAVAVIKMRRWNVDVASALEIFICMTLTALFAVQEPATQVCGFKILIDVRGVSLRQIRSFGPRYAILMAKAFTNCMPIRFKGIHIYNESPIFQYLLSILKLFLTEKMKKRIHLHGDSQKDLHKHIPKAILSMEEFGGDNPNDDAAWYSAELEKFLESYRQLTTYGYRQ